MSLPKSRSISSAPSGELKLPQGPRGPGLPRLDLTRVSVSGDGRREAPSVAAGGEAGAGQAKDNFVN